MASPASPNRGRRLCLAAVGAVMLTALTTAADAAVVAQAPTAASQTNRLGHDTASSRSGDTISPLNLGRAASRSRGGS